MYRVYRHGLNSIIADTTSFVVVVVVVVVVKLRINCSHIICFANCTPGFAFTYQGLNRKLNYNIMCFRIHHNMSVLGF